jgi:hypothetical protein
VSTCPNRNSAFAAIALLTIAFCQPAGAADPKASAPEMLGEISDQNATFSPPPPCPLATCGVVISIAQVEGNVTWQPGGNVTVVTPFIGPSWQIRVQLQDGNIVNVVEDYGTFLRIGDVVVVQDNSVRLWP